MDIGQGLGVMGLEFLMFYVELSKKTTATNGFVFPIVSEIITKSPKNQLAHFITNYYSSDRIVLNN